MLYFGGGNINADPLFIDPGNGDVHLQIGSPCIDTGDPNSSLDLDGTRADMGAFWFEQPDDDWDNDGLLDADEIAFYGTNPEIFDTDDDGLGDGQELGMTDATVTGHTDLSVFRQDKDPSTTTDPLNADTDGGGLSDGNEDANKDGTFMLAESDPNNDQDDFFTFAVTNLVSGQEAVLISTSCKPGGVVYPVYSLQGQGPTPSFGLGFDLMLTTPLKVLPPGLVSPSGTAVSTIRIPPNAPSGYNVYWQAVEVFYGVIYRASNPLVTQIQ